MPLPKMPSRPAAILSFPADEDAPRQNSAQLQPELEGISPAPTPALAKAPNIKPATPPKPAEASAKPAAPKASRGAKTAAPRRGKAAAQAEHKLFVLDTNVLLHDPSSLFRFEEHDIFLPMMTLEELDHQKKGMS
ncbi:PIN domain-containing protein, partial [Bordetella avium]